jgi:uncharacterized protein (UPF0303 family)
MFVWYNLENNELYQTWAEDDSFGIAGDGFPITVQGQVLGAICVSGLVQEEDHQIVTEAIANIKAIQHI